MSFCESVDPDVADDPDGKVLGEVEYELDGDVVEPVLRASYVRSICWRSDAVVALFMRERHSAWSVDDKLLSLQTSEALDE